MASAKDSNIRYVCVGLTDVGRVREHNEDNFLVAQLTAGKRGKSGEVFSGPMEQRGLSLVVADGMGGAAAGEVASQMAVDTIHGELAGADLGGTIRSEEAVIALLEGAINKANEQIFKKGQESKDHQGMGTTLTAAMVLGDSLYLSQVGDSRGYLLRKGKLVQMTRDQSLIGQLIEEGTLTEEQAEKLGGKNIILQALGVEESLKIDSKRYDILRGDTLLLCSDGLSGMAPDAKLEEILNAEPDLAKAAKMLIEAANAGGGKDNITCILARIEGEGLREPLAPVTDAEKAGGSFRAPTLKKSNAGRNAVIATGAILAVVGVALFWPKDVALLVHAGPKAGTVTVSPAKEGGAEGWNPQTKEFQPGTPVRIDLPRGKKFDVKASAPDYEEQTRLVDTDVKHQEISETFDLVRTPAPTADFVPPRHKGRTLSRVKVLLVPRENQKADDKALDVLDSPTPEFDKNCPAGKWTAKVMRDGFVDGTFDFEAKSKEPLVVPLPEMTESLGTLVASNLPEGAEVTVFDGDEPLLDKPAVVQATRSTTPLSVRGTEVVVKAAHKGYEFSERRVRVEGGKDAPPADFGATPAKISFKAPVGSELRLSGPKPLGITFGSEVEKRTVVPGTYKVTFINAAGDESPPYELVVEPGRILVDLDAATGK
jgi:serine/threonine protein phosphatase PrpC